MASVNYKPLRTGKTDLKAYKDNDILHDESECCKRKTINDNQKSSQRLQELRQPSMRTHSAPRAGDGPFWNI